MSSHTPINKPGGKINTQDIHEDYIAFSPCSQTEYNKKKIWNNLWNKMIRVKKKRDGIEINLKQYDTIKIHGRFEKEI